MKGRCCLVGVLLRVQGYCLLGSRRLKHSKLPGSSSKTLGGGLFEDQKQS